MFRITRIALALLITCAVAGGVHAQADPAIATDARLAAPSPFSPAFSDLGGFTSNITQDPGNVCFGAREQVEFNAGERIAFNVTWEDVVMDPPGLQTYEVTWGLLLAGGPLLIGPFDVPFDMSGFQPGDPVSLCAVWAVDAPRVAQRVSIPWGGRTVDPWVDPPLPPLQGVLGEIVLIAEPGAADRR